MTGSKAMQNMAPNQATICAWLKREFVAEEVLVLSRAQVQEAQRLPLTYNNDSGYPNVGDEDRA